MINGEKEERSGEKRNMCWKWVHLHTFVYSFTPIFTLWSNIVSWHSNLLYMNYQVLHTMLTFNCVCVSQVAVPCGASPVCSVRRPPTSAGVSACPSWTHVPFWLSPAACAPPWENATASRVRRVETPHWCVAATSVPGARWLVRLRRRPHHAPNRFTWSPNRFAWLRTPK